LNILTKVTLARSNGALPDDDDYTETCWGLIVVPCMLFQSLIYCSNSCTSLHFKTL